MKTLRAALSAWEPATEAAADPVLVITSAWPAIVGDDVAANTRPLELTRGALVVVTRSNAWSQQLAFLSEPVCAAVRDRTGLAIERIRFRVGRVAVQRPGAAVKRSKRAARAPRAHAEPAQTAQDALRRFQAGVAAAERAKATAGWKQCNRCGARILPTAEPFCVPCANAREEERTGTVARLLFEVPWLGYAGVAPLVERLSPQEYQAIRRRLLARWWDVLCRARRLGRATARDRMIASSYVLLKSELDPEKIAPAVVRDLLGDELHQIIYGSEITV